MKKLHFAPYSIHNNNNACRLTIETIFAIQINFDF